jgi:hypothetical protein
MQKRVCDVTMLEHVGTLIFMPEMDAIIFEARAEAAGGRRDDREVTSPGCRYGTSEACSMVHGHT